jgi:hypothetical protein
VPQSVHDGDADSEASLQAATPHAEDSAEENLEESDWSTVDGNGDHGEDEEESEQ